MSDVASHNVYLKRVKDFMSRDVVTIDASDTIHEALVVMGENRVSALPVVDSKQHCVGILSTSDLVDMTRDVDDELLQLESIDPNSLRFLLERLTHSLGGESVQSFMSEVVVSVDIETTIARAAREMLRNRVHHLPVLSDRGLLIGIISSMDLLAEFADAAPDQ